MSERIVIARGERFPALQRKPLARAISMIGVQVNNFLRVIAIIFALFALVLMAGLGMCSAGMGNGAGDMGFALIFFFICGLLGWLIFTLVHRIIKSK